MEPKVHRRQPNNEAVSRIISVRLRAKDMRRLRELQQTEGEDGHPATITIVILRAIRELHAIRHPEGGKW